MAAKDITSIGVFVAKLAATGLACWLIFRSIDVGSAVEIIKNAALAGFGFAFLLLLVQVIANGFRWSVIARSCDITLRPREAARRFWESLFFGQFTPSGIGGDAWRVIAVTKKGASVANAMNSVILDRVIGAGALVLIVLSGFVITFTRGGLVDNQSLMIGIGMALTLVGGVITLIALRKLPEQLFHWDKFGIRELLTRISQLMHRAFANPALLIGMTALSVAGHLVCATAVWVIARNIGFDPGLGVCFIIVPLAVLISMIPITIAGWGLREGVIAAGFVNAGASLEIAGAVSLMFGFGLALIGLTGGLLLWSSRLRLVPELPTAEKSLR